VTDYTKPALPEPPCWGAVHTEKSGRVELSPQQYRNALDAAFMRGVQAMQAQAARIAEMETALRKILEEPSNTMSDGKALKEIVRIARAVLAPKESSK
jgi:hypothetical protein